MNLNDPAIAQLLQQFALTEAEKDAARKRAIATFGFGLLGAKKGREGEAIGRAGLLGMQAGDNAKFDAQQGKMRDFTLAQYAGKMREQDEAKKAADALAQQKAQFEQGLQSVGSVPPWLAASGPVPKPMGGADKYRAMAEYAAVRDPTRAKIYSDMAGKQESPYAKVDPKDYTPDSMSAYVKSGNPADLRRFQEPPQTKSPVGSVSPGDFTPASLAKFLQSGSYADLVPVDKSPRVSVNVDNSPKLPPGFRWKDGMVGQAVEPITGGPTDTSKQDASRTGTKTASLNLVRDAISDAKNLTSKYSVGLVGVPLSKIPGTDATDLRRKVDTIVANIGFDRLQQMREESKTGGALGQVAVQELDMLQATLGSLKQDQSAKQFLTTLDTVDQQYARVLKAMDAMRSGKQSAANDPLDIRSKK